MYESAKNLYIVPRSYAQLVGGVFPQRPEEIYILYWATLRRIQGGLQRFTACRFPLSAMTSA